MATKPQLEQSEQIEALPAACVNETAAVEFFEAQRWGALPCCVHCGSVEVYKMAGRDGQRSKRFLWRCRDCSKQYTVRTGSIYEESLVPMTKWARAFWEAACCKNGISALELKRKVQVSYPTALFMLHRLRKAMSTDHTDPPKMGGVVEVDETYCGGTLRRREGRGALNALDNKVPVVAMIQRGGNVRMMTMPIVAADTMNVVLQKHLDASAHLMTDGSKVYQVPGKAFSRHSAVSHSTGEYVRRGKMGRPDAHVNTAESVFKRLKLALAGTYIAVSPKHLHRYVAEVEFRMNSRAMNDGDRVTQLIRMADGKRLTYADQVAA